MVTGVTLYGLCNILLYSYNNKYKFVKMIFFTSITDVTYYCLWKSYYKQ